MHSFGSLSSIVGGVFVLLILLFIRAFGKNARATREAGRLNVWGLVSEVRFPRIPKGRWFRSKKGLK